MITESVVEETTLAWFESLGYQIISGPDISPGEPGAERDNYKQVILINRLRTALETINPNLPSNAIEEALRAVTRPKHPDTILNNREFQKMLTTGIGVSYRSDGREKHELAWLLDLDNPENNDWLVVNQFTVQGDGYSRRPDVVVFVNGLPLAVIELKNPAQESATLYSAYTQLQDYKSDIPGLFFTNQLLIISDGMKALAGSITAGWDRFMPWRTVDGNDIAPRGSVELEIMLKGIFDKHRFLDLILNFVAFEDDASEIQKKIASYHQFHAVNKAVEKTFSACGFQYNPGQLTGRYPKFIEPYPGHVRERATYSADPDHFGKRRIGVVWHTQGSGKSLTMTYFAGKLIRHPGMKNPTIVIITDRNDLDQQLFNTFSRCSELLRQEPTQAEDMTHLKALLNVASGGVVFTTIQKFLPPTKGGTYPVLSTRENIIVIADEAHRSQYGFIKGFARHLHDALPNASFIGFSGTPIKKNDKDTERVFGDCFDTYDILRAVEDHNTVPIYYEGRMAKLELLEEEKPYIDSRLEEITEDEEEDEKRKIRTRWARLEALVGTPKRIAKVAEDLVAHFEQRLEAMDGKAMIVCMSRRICVDMYNALIKLRPNWHHPDDAEGTLKIVMTGHPSDRTDWRGHIRSKERRDRLAKRFKNPDDPMKIVIVRDMWLTGFDCPSLHTMYIDKPMRDHGLMQAIARVNRVFKDKPGGLVVDYIGLAHQIKEALITYTEAGGTGQAAVSQDEAAAIMMEKYEIVKEMFHNFDYLPIVTSGGEKRLRGIAAAMEHIIAPDDRKKQYLQAVTDLSRAFALAVPHPHSIAIRDELGFFQEVRAALSKSTVEGEPRTPEEIDAAVRQLVSRAVAADQVIDIFAAAGLKKPDISIISDSFLNDIRQFPHKNLAVELLRKLLHDEINKQRTKNVVQAQSFAQMLEESIRRYRNRAIEAAQVIEELIGLAGEISEAKKRGEKLKLTDEELAFYDALETNDSAVKLLGDETLKKIAGELVKAVRENVKIDWTVRENVRAGIRVIVKRILRKYGYPPDKQQKATETVLKQAEVLCKDWTM